MIVGGGQRGVVLQRACYIARTYGVRSAMPMFEARRLCPDAAIVKPNMAKYRKVGREVRSTDAALTPQVEPLSIDEAFLDLTGTERLHGIAPAKIACRICRRGSNARSASPCRSACPANKFLAKIASDLDKPRGFAVLSSEEAIAFLAKRPVTYIFGESEVV